MNIRQPSSMRPMTNGRLAEIKPRKKQQRGLVITILVMFLAGLLSWLFLGVSDAGTLGSPIKSGYSGYCLDDYRSRNTSGNQVDLWPCNGSGAQEFTLSLSQIMHDNSLCLSADSDTDITIDNCSSAANQIWLRDASGFINPNSGLCLTAAASGEGQPLILSSCINLNKNSQTWTPSLNYSTYPCTGSQGQKVACYAIKEWVSWQNQPDNHQALLNNYTAGASFEEWCADFVSYVYREAGYPFTNGNYDGWNENIASDIVNQGFSVHKAGSYIPQPGDVAYFDYPGGHVEIVVSGGKTPTFVYGNSEAIDPTTGNGDMAANTITSRGSFGSVQYYMSPNSQT